jgi:hypothetical protein
MKRISFIVLSVFLISSCQKRNEPVKTMFSGNVNPNVESVKSFIIGPENPTINSPLTVSVPKNINVGSIVWYINNQQSMVANSLHGDFKKGDNITAVVNYSNSKSKQAVVTTPAVTINDTPPGVTSIILNPLYPTIASTIHAAVQTFDADGDSVSLTYQWYVNGNPVSDQTGDSFSCGSYKHGDMVYVMVTPSDGEETGVGVTSAYISIQDTPPIIVSVPPTSITGSTFSYKVEALDIDNDPLSYKLESAPKGMTINNNGVITWNTQDVTPPFNAPVKVVVDDGFGGKAYQTFNFKIEKKTL